MRSSTPSSGAGHTFDAQRDRVVRFEARRLRRDLDSYYVDTGARDPVRITIPKGGYVPHFEWHRAPTGAPSSDDTEREGGGGRLSGQRAQWQSPTEPLAPILLARRLGVRLAGLIAVALLAAAVGLWLWFRGPSTPAEEVRGPAVIVLPFETLSASEDDRFLASGVTQELITALMRFEGFRLYSVPASFSQDARADPVALGHDLGVGYVVKGSVSSDAATVRVGAQLFNAQTGRVIWSETYDRAPTAGALLGIRAELPPDIATALGQSYGVLNSDMTARLSAGVEPSMASYACVLRASHLPAHRPGRANVGRSSPASMRRSQRDPDYAEPWAMLGWLHLDAARFAFVPDAEVPGELEPGAGHDLEGRRHRPAERDRASGAFGGPVPPGQLRQVRAHPAPGAGAEPERPRHADATWLAAGVSRSLGRGLPYVERAIARTINPPGWYYDTITIHLYLEGRYREMLVAAEHSAAGDYIGMSFLAIAHGALGDHAAAREALARMAEQAPAFSIATLPPSSAVSTCSTASSTRSWTACEKPVGPSLALWHQ